VRSGGHLVFVLCSVVSGSHDDRRGGVGFLQSSAGLGAGPEGDGDADQGGPGRQRTLLQIPPQGGRGRHGVNDEHTTLTEVM